MAGIASRFERYIDEGLGLTGFALLDHEIAFTLRRDIWRTPLMAAQDLSWTSVQNYVASLPRVKLLEVRFVGAEDVWVPVATRSDHELTDRIRWLTGMDVAAVRDARHRAVEPAGRRAAPTEEIPAWPCAARTEALEKRGERDKYANTAPTRSS